MLRRYRSVAIERSSRTMRRLRSLQWAVSLALILLLLYEILPGDQRHISNIALQYVTRVNCKDPQTPSLDKEQKTPKQATMLATPKQATMLATPKQATMLATPKHVEKDTTCDNDVCTRNKERITTLRHSCSKLNETRYRSFLNANQLNNNFIRIADSRPNLVYCDMPKIGSTFVKQVFAIISGLWRTSDPFKVSDEQVHYLAFKTFKRLDFSDIARILDQSSKFLIVREPYARLLSAYVDKLFTTNTVFWDTVGKGVIRNARKGNAGKSCGHDVTFAEFVRHVIMAEKTGNQRNPHWYPVYYACKPCHIKYDFVGKLETFNSDFKYILSKTKFKASVDLSNMDRGNDDEAIALTIERAFSVKKMKVQCITLADSLKRAWKVLQVRGIVHHGVPFPRNLTQSKSIDQKTLHEAIVQARKFKPISKDDKKRMKKETMTKAYMTVPLVDLNEFRTLFEPDFTLFGYNTDPDFIKNRNTYSKHEWQPFD